MSVSIVDEFACAQGEHSWLDRRIPTMEGGCRTVTYCSVCQRTWSQVPNNERQRRGRRR